MGNGLDEASQPLRPALSLPLLRSFDVSDMPDGHANAVALELVGLAVLLGDRLHLGSQPEDLEAARKLRELSARSQEEQVEGLMRAAFASRELRWLKHYRLYGPKIMQTDVSRGATIRGSAWLQRNADAAALFTQQGDMLLNGYRIRGLPQEAVHALRFCMGIYTGSSGKRFRLTDVPGPEAIAVSVV